MASPTTLSLFPIEVLNHILDLLPKDALANLRLASRHYKLPAEYYLFRHLTLRSSTRSAAMAREIIQQDSLAPFIRKFSFYASFSARDANPHRDDLVRHVVHDLRKLIRLNSLSLVFDRTTNGASSYTLTPKIMYGSDVFAFVFSSLTISHFFSRKLYRLSIANLQSRNEPYVTTSLGFLELISNIRALELDISTIEHDCSWGTRRMSTGTLSFYLQLPSVWLAPASPNLRILHLSADAPWGWYPKVDFRGIHFPNLRDLTLVRFTFSHDWHLQWLSNHTASLKSLVLMECAILDHATSTRQHFDSEGHPQGIEPNGGNTEILGSHSHKTRWSHYFKAIEDFLPELWSFSLLSPDHVFRATETEILPIRHPHRYLKYCSGNYSPLFNNYISTADEVHTAILSEVGKAQQEKDERALRELLVMIQRRNSTRA